MVQPVDKVKNSIYTRELIWEKIVADRLKVIEEQQKEIEALKQLVKTHIWVRVKHMFGIMTNTLKGIMIRSIGMVRACFNIGLINLIYNLSPYAYLRRIRTVRPKPWEMGHMMG
jgi:hypothetical protein